MIEIWWTYMQYELIIFAAEWTMHAENASYALPAWFMVVVYNMWELTLVSKFVMSKAIVWLDYIDK